MRCPECKDGELVTIRIKDEDIAELSVPLQVAKRMPLNYALVRATRAQQVSSAVRCIISGCMEPVTHFCLTKCKDQCAKHERDGHAAASGFADHVRVPIAHKAAHLEAQEQKVCKEVVEVVAKELRKLLQPHAAAIQDVRAAVDTAEVQLAKRRKGQQKRSS